MAPKKKGGKKGGPKSAAIQAKEAELAQEAELLRFEQTKEKLRNEELMLRQRIEEEERKVLEDQRIREQSMRNAINERSRLAYYENREKELSAQLEMRERDAQELHAKLLGVQQAQLVLQNEKESAMRRTAMLNNELELVQMKHLEAQGLVESTERDFQAARRVLEEQYDNLHQVHCELRADNERLQASIEELRAEKESEDAEREAAAAEAISTGVDVNLKNVKPQSSDAETAVLLKVLHAEVEKYKDIAASLQSDIDHKNRDEEKSSLLVSIMNTQLDSVREENKRLHTTAQNRLQEVQAAHQLVEEERAKNKKLYLELDQATSESAVTQRQLLLEIGVHKKQVDELSERLATLTTEYTTLDEQHKDHIARSTTREQEDFQTNVNMQAELNKQKNDLALLLKEKQGVQDEAFNYKVLTRAELDSLKTRLQKLQEASERKERDSYETITILRAEADKYTTEINRNDAAHKDEVARLVEELEVTREKRDSLDKQLEATKEKLASTEMDLYHRLVHMTACHDSKHAEVERLRARLAEKEEEYTNNTIYLNAEVENLKTRSEELLEEAGKRRAEHLDHIEKMTADLNELQDRLTKEINHKEGTVVKERSRADLGERNVQRLLDQIRQLTTEANKKEHQTSEAMKAMRSEARELRSELGLAKRTIERLEVAIGDQAGYKQLTELNEKLSKEVCDYRAQVSHLNSVVASMKMEEGVMGGQQIQRLNEENEQLVRKITQLDRGQKLTAPLFKELRTLVERNGAVPSSIRAALEKYDIQMTRLKPRGSTNTPCCPEIPVQQNASETPAAEFNTTLPAVLRPHPPSKRRDMYITVEKFTTSSGTVIEPTVHSSNLPCIESP